jgi:protein-tyrosine phosphatase
MVFIQQLFDFVEGALAAGSSVLIHCLAGAHRAGTTGCLMLMHKTGLGADQVSTCSDDVSVPRLAGFSLIT